jgi:hypothetical protein
MDHSLHAACTRSFSSETSLTWTTSRTLSTRPFKLCEVLVFQLVAGPSSCTWEAEQVFGFAVPGSYSRTLRGNRVQSHVEISLSLSAQEAPLYSICTRQSPLYAVLGILFRSSNMPGLVFVLHRGAFGDVAAEMVSYSRCETQSPGVGRP